MVDVHCILPVPECILAGDLFSNPMHQDSDVVHGRGEDRLPLSQGPVEDTMTVLGFRCTTISGDRVVAEDVPDVVYSVWCPLF